MSQLDNPNNCSLVHALNIIGGKWKPVILHKLYFRTLRFGQLAAIIPGISRTILTKQLKELENDGVITRQKFAEIPPRVEYSLTEKGKSLIPVLKSISQWSLFHYPNQEFQDFDSFSEAGE